MKNRPGHDKKIPLNSEANGAAALNEPDSAVGPQQRKWLTAGVVVATIVAVLLVKFAFDVFVIVFLFACLALVLHAGSKLIAESELLSPAWIVITLLLVATAVWVVTPSETLEKALRFERYLPQPVIAFLDWSAERGWAQRVLVPGGPGGGADTTTGSAPGSFDIAKPLDSPVTNSPRSTVTLSRGISVTVSTLQTAIRVGQPVTITATVTFARAPSPNASTTVRFLDGGLQIGSAPITLSGTIAVASITTTAMLLGDHTITASYAGPGLFGTVTSSPLTVTVTQ
jgi:hypothetical protein